MSVNLMHPLRKRIKGIEKHIEGGFFAKRRKAKAKLDMQAKREKRIICSSSGAFYGCFGS